MNENPPEESDLPGELDANETRRLLALLLEIYAAKPLAALLKEMRLHCEVPSVAELKRLRDPKAPPMVAFDPSTRAAIRANLLPEPPRHWEDPAFEFIDLFAGIGGLRRGFEEAGGKCVFTNEWDARARRTYLANHYVEDKDLDYFLEPEMSGNARNQAFMDITNITRSGDPGATAEDCRKSIEFHIPPHDVLLAGFPCQPFSVAGVSKKNSLGHAHGFDCTTQGTLFFDVQQVLSIRKPRFFVLENVKNLKSHDRGNTFETIIRALDEIGYWVADVTSEDGDIEAAIRAVRKRSPEPTIIDGAAFTPQHRERIVLVGVRKDVMEQVPEVTDLTLADVERPAKRYSVADILCELSTDQVEKYTLTPNLWNYLFHYALKHQSKGNGFGFGLVDPSDPRVVTRTLSARYYKDGSEILINHRGLEPEYLSSRREPCIRKNAERTAHAAEVARNWREQHPDGSDADQKEVTKQSEHAYDATHGRYAVEFDPRYKTPRRLTPRECARLMGFERPEHDRGRADRDFRIVCSDAAAYKQFGNSVVVPVFAAVARLLQPFIARTKEL